jgi:hypothetical protein
MNTLWWREGEILSPTLLRERLFFRSIVRDELKWYSSSQFDVMWMMWCNFRDVNAPTTLTITSDFLFPCHLQDYLRIVCSDTQLELNRILHKWTRRKYSMEEKFRESFLILDIEINSNLPLFNVCLNTLNHVIIFKKFRKSANCTNKIVITWNEVKKLRTRRNRLLLWYWYLRQLKIKSWGIFVSEFNETTLKNRILWMQYTIVWWGQVHITCVCS